MYSQSANGNCSESAVTSLNNSFRPLLNGTTEHVHVLPVRAIPGSMAQLFCLPPASSHMLPLWTAVTMSVQQLERLQILLPPRKKLGSKARKVVFQQTERWPFLLAMDPGKKVPQQQGLGWGLRWTGDSGAWEALHSCALQRWVLHSCHTAFILPGEVFYQTCFIFQEATCSKHACTQEKKLCTKQVTFSFATYLKLSKTWGWYSQNPRLGYSQNLDMFLRDLCCSFLGCHNTGQINAL